MNNYFDINTNTEHGEYTVDSILNNHKEMQSIMDINSTSLITNNIFDDNNEPVYTQLPGTSESSTCSQSFDSYQLKKLLTE